MIKKKSEPTPSIAKHQYNLIDFICIISHPQRDYVVLVLDIIFTLLVLILKGHRL